MGSAIKAVFYYGWATALLGIIYVDVYMVNAPFTFAAWIEFVLLVLLLILCISLANSATKEANLVQIISNTSKTPAMLKLDEERNVKPKQ